MRETSYDCAYIFEARGKKKNVKGKNIAEKIACSRDGWERKRRQKRKGGIK